MPERAPHADPEIGRADIRYALGVHLIRLVTQIAESPGSWEHTHGRDYGTHHSELHQGDTAQNEYQSLLDRAVDATARELGVPREEVYEVNNCSEVSWEGHNLRRGPEEGNGVGWGGWPEIIGDRLEAENHRLRLRLDRLEAEVARRVEINRLRLQHLPPPPPPQQRQPPQPPVLPEHIGPGLNALVGNPMLPRVVPDAKPVHLLSQPRLPPPIAIPSVKPEPIDDAQPSGAVLQPKRSLPVDEPQTDVKPFPKRQRTDTLPRVPRIPSGSTPTSSNSANISQAVPIFGFGGVSRVRREQVEEYERGVEVVPRSGRETMEVRRDRERLNFILSPQRGGNASISDEALREVSEILRDRSQSSGNLLTIEEERIYRAVKALEASRKKKE